mgnify:CR=1 FL=1
MIVKKYINFKYFISIGHLQIYNIVTKVLGSSLNSNDIFM